MSVRNCDFPWHWLLVTNDGEVMPCSHGSAPVGDLRRSSMAEIWNGTTLREVRASIVRGEVHPVCRSAECPFQRNDVAFPEAKGRLELKEPFARAFDEAWYLAAYPDVAEAVVARQMASGLEHFVRHGRAEGRQHRLRVARRPAHPFRALRDFLRAWIHGPSAGLPRLPDSIQCLVEYSAGITKVTTRPVDLVVVVSTVCNLRCVMCPHGMGLVERPRHMPLDILESVAPFIASASRMIVSGLAEPLIAPAFWRVLELVSRRDDLFIRVNSNGHLLTAERAAKLLDSRLAEISFSIDAATPETYARIRGADLDRPLAGIRELLRMREERAACGMKIFLNMTLMRENLTETAAFVELAAEVGADAVVLSQLFSFGDRPDWVVQRKSWRFEYSEQMLSRIPDEARRHVWAAQERAAELRMPIVYLSNVREYLQGGSACEPERVEAVG